MSQGAPPFVDRRRFTLALAGAATAAPGMARACPNGDRTLAVDTRAGLFVGLRSYPRTLSLQDREVVLTFDDGPLPGPTNAVLDALKRECARATFFLIGRNAAANPALARRILAEGHTVAHHSMTHPMTLAHLPLDRALADIEQGFRAVDMALYGAYSGAPRTPFFRFPGFGDSPALNSHLAARGIGVFGADFWASDWNDMTPDAQLRLTLGRLDKARRGVVLFHDTRPQTAAMIPDFLREMKRRGYRLVHIRPA